MQVSLEIAGSEKPGLPKNISSPKAPPLKCQGIKTKLVQFISASIRWGGNGRWIEPFLGSGVVAFNMAPERALLADTNVHLIRFYQSITNGTITPEDIRKHLEQEGELLAARGDEHYYYIRERFNREGNPLDFLFLNRSCYNGLVRFNRKGEFNVPFCKRPDRFRPAFISRVVNQVAWVAEVANGKQWEFRVADWRETLEQAEATDFVYADPPYPGRHNDYFNAWGEEETDELLLALQQLPCGYALSTWKRNRYRGNKYTMNLPEGITIRTFKHHYHVGPKVENRGEVEEALVLPEWCAS